MTIYPSICYGGHDAVKVITIHNIIATTRIRFRDSDMIAGDDATPSMENKYGLQYLLEELFFLNNF